MNSGTTIVGLIMVLICIIPFVIMSYNKKSKQRKMLKSLNDIAKQQQCSINQHEFCGDYIIGIDEKRNFVFFFKQKNETSVSQYIDLSEIQSCQAVMKSRNLKYNTENVSIIEHVALSFSPTNKKKASESFELYVEEINMQLTGELHFVDKWTALINDRLKK